MYKRKSDIETLFCKYFNDTEMYKKTQLTPKSRFVSYLYVTLSSDL